MSKRLNIINLGEDFKEKRNLEQGEYYKEFLTLRECYGRWSDAKERVYNYYLDMLQKNTDAVLSYGIRSYNCNIINLHAVVEKEGKKLYLMITPSYNYYKELGE